MEYELRGKIQVNKPMTELRKEILGYLEQSEEAILKTIKNREEMKFSSSYDIEEKFIRVKMKSKNHSCAMIFYRIKKSLALLLGKNLRIGIKNITLDSLIVQFTVEKKPLLEITIPYVYSIEFDLDSMQCTYQLNDIPKEFITKNYIERITKLIKEKIERGYYEGKAEYHQVLYSSPKKKPIFDRDPTEEMRNQNWISPASSKGKWVYWTPAVAVFNAMKEIIYEHLIIPLDFQEIINSNIVSGEDIWLRSGHLEGMPMEIYYVVEPKTRDVKEWEKFIDLIKITKQIPYEEFSNMIQLEPLKGLVYAQCPSIYWTLKNKTIAEDSFPILLFEGTTNSFRYESGGRHGIERVDEFHRIEIIYIGKPDTLISLKAKLLEKYKYIFNEILDIEWRMAQVTPFYMQQAGKFGNEDNSEQTQLGTIDFEAWLPYRGNRSETEWIEFQNLSIVGDKYIKAFNIKQNQNAEIWSGCTGIGLERWVAVFLAQKGLDPEKWPDSFKKYLLELPKTLKIF